MALLIADINLALQIVILAFLFVSLAFKRKGKFALHGGTMLVVVVLNAASFFLVMLPSFFAQNFSALSPSIGIIAPVHGILGGIAEILGIFLVAAWGLQKTVQSCVKRRMIMRITIALWIAALALGILLYAALYGIIIL
ncbi:hypothetical protein HXY32_03250 [Candidatus Bathyarchaeota archaeon]|nr:hypothetical protein [Candidatus Bathyarchaeota archaeon]